MASEFYELKTEVKILDPVENLCFKQDTPRDLLSKITNTYNFDKNFYHQSAWKVDGIPIAEGIKLGLLNPYSNHPTSKGHTRIADILSPEIEKLIRS
jgi:hypothetical protein